MRKKHFVFKLKQIISWHSWPTPTWLN